MSFYRKTYLCVCEGQQEKMYLRHVASLLKKSPESVVSFNTVIDKPYRLRKTYEEYDHAALFDFDFNEVEFKNNIEICDKLDKENRPTKRKNGKRVYHAYSNVNFDLWLILHKECFSKSVSGNHAYVVDVRRIYGLSKTDDIKKKSVVEKIINQIGTTIYYSNPDFSIDIFLEKVLLECGEIE